MEKANAFLPTDYKAPKSGGNYMKFEQGDNLFRVLDSPIIGWIQWVDKKPSRTKYSDGIPETIDTEHPPKHFWAMPIWNYKTKQVEILEITQKGIQEFILMQTQDEEWGSPVQYDLNVKRNGEGLETKYQCIAKMPKKLSEEVATAWVATPVNLEALFSSEDPFASTTITAEEQVIDQIDF